MNTKQLVQNSANVIRITEIKAGDLYKRFDLDYDYTYYGIIENIHNDGENTIITATEYKVNYGSIEVNNKVITSKKDVVIFPCTLEEFNLEFETAKQQKVEKIEKLKQDIKSNEKQIKDLEELISGAKQKKLSVMSYQELSQVQFEEKKKAIEMI